jgi:hypothetical protein
MHVDTAYSGSVAAGGLGSIGAAAPASRSAAAPLEITTTSSPHPDAVSSEARAQSGYAADEMRGARWLTAVFMRAVDLVRDGERDGRYAMNANITGRHDVPMKEQT